MTSHDPRTERSVAELSRHLLQQAYPDRTSSWVDQQVAGAVERIDLAIPQQRTFTAAGPSRRRRGLVFLLVVVGGAALVVSGILLRELLAAVAVQVTGVYLLAGAVAVAAALTAWTKVRDRRAKILSCRVRINSRLDFEHFDAGEMLSLKGPDGSVIEDLGMVVVRVKNLGGTTIEPEDYAEQLQLRFPGRQVVSVDVTESEPVHLQNVVVADLGFRITADSIMLPETRLQPDDSFKMVIVLSGTKVGVKHEVPVEGRLRHGRITTESIVPRISRPTIFAGSLTLLAIGMLAVVLLLNNVRPFTPLPDGLVCVPGALTVEGSSAFGLAATATAGEYHAYCADSTVDVRSPGSIEGLNRLRDAPEAERPGRLALVDGRQSQADFAGLVSRPLAIVPFTFVVNDRAPVRSLTTTQVVEIFTGKVSRWSQITGNLDDTAEIRVVGRAATSGTRRTLERYLLGMPQGAATSESCDSRRQEAADARAVVCERSTTADVLNRVSAVPFSIGYADVADVRQAAGVRQVSLDNRDATLDGIRAGYPFWTVEYVYSYGQPVDGSLATAFANYLTGPAGTRTMARFEYFVCDPSVAELCANSGR